MLKIIGAIIGFLIIRFFVLSNIEVLGFQAFLRALEGGLQNGTLFDKDAWKFYEWALKTDTSIKLIAGTIAGGALGWWFEQNANKKNILA
jgi:F0F1-type ATP synthase assembly protein I